MACDAGLALAARGRRAFPELAKFVSGSIGDAAGRNFTPEMVFGLSAGMGPPLAIQDRHLVTERDEL